MGSTVAWLQTFRALEYEPRAILAAQQIASLVNLSRAALLYSDSIARVSLIKTLADQESVRIVPREPGDYTAKQWHGITESMFPRAGLSDQERALVLDFLEKNAKPM